MKTSSIVNGSHFVDESQCKSKQNAEVDWGYK